MINWAEFNNPCYIIILIFFPATYILSTTILLVTLYRDKTSETALNAMSRVKQNLAGNAVTRQITCDQTINLMVKS